MSQSRIPRNPTVLTAIIPSQRRRAWPKHPDARPVSYLPLHVALTRPFTTDAHLAAYNMPTMPYRLSSGAVWHPDLPDGIHMRLAIFDIDGHRQVDIEAWWHAERLKVMALRDVQSGMYTYRTRSGYRCLGILPGPVPLHAREEGEAWCQQYLTWVAYLERAFGIQADPACKDWTRIFRLPHARREPDGQPEDHETIGDARHIGVWAPKLMPEDVTHAVALGRGRSTRERRAVSSASHTGTGVLYCAFDKRQWIGEELEADKWSCVCPWDVNHTMGARFDTSTVLWAPGRGEEVGWWHCSHAHCQGRGLRDVLALFTPGELDRAWEVAGIMTVNAQGIRISRAQYGPRTVPAREVASCVR
jgi:hypothetical protein